MTKMKTISLIKAYQALDVALTKKKLKTFYQFFPDLIYIFQALSKPWKIAGQI